MKKFSTVQEAKFQHLEGGRHAGSGPQSPHFSSSSSVWRGCAAKHLGQEQGLWWDWGTGSIPLKKHPSLCGPGPTLLPRGKNLSAAALMVDLKHPQAKSGKKRRPLSLYSVTPAGIQGVSPPEISLAEISSRTIPWLSKPCSWPPNFTWNSDFKWKRTSSWGNNAHCC